MFYCLLSQLNPSQKSVSTDYVWLLRYEMSQQMSSQCSSSSGKKRKKFSGSNSGQKKTVKGRNLGQILPSCIQRGEGMDRGRESPTAGVMKLHPSLTRWQLEPYTHVWLNWAGVNVNNLCILTELIFICYICSGFTAKEEKIIWCGMSSIQIHLRR